MPEIVISQFQRGQASSPYLGDGAYAKAAALDINRKGIARINYLPVIGTGDIDAPVLNIASDPGYLGTAHVYCVDSNGAVYKSTGNGSAWTELVAAKGTHCIIWKDYLFVAGTTKLNTYGPISGGGAADWLEFQADLQNVSKHRMMISEHDDKLYICNDRYVATLEEVTTFADGDAGTYTWTPTALTLPLAEESHCLAEQKDDILIGTKGGTIYIWDRYKSEYDYPIYISGDADSMLSFENKVYIAEDDFGRVYIYDESGLRQLFQIPFDYDNGAVVRISEFGYQGLAYHNGKLYVTVESLDGLHPAGIWSYDLKTKALNCDYLVSTGRDGSGVDIYVYCIISHNKKYLLWGFQDLTGGATVGLDHVDDANNRYTGYIAYFESLFYRIGTKGRPGNVEKIEVQLARPLQTGEGVKIEYRTEINGSWKSLNTTEFATRGAFSSYIFPGPKSVKNIQLKVSLTTGATKNTPYLQELRLTF